MQCDICHLDYPTELPIIWVAGEEYVICLPCLMFWCLSRLSGNYEDDIAQRTYDLTGEVADPVYKFLEELPWPPND